MTFGPLIKIQCVLISTSIVIPRSSVTVLIFYFVLFHEERASMMDCCIVPKEKSFLPLMQPVMLFVPCCLLHTVLTASAIFQNLPTFFLPFIMISKQSFTERNAYVCTICLHIYKYLFNLRSLWKVKLHIFIFDLGYLQCTPFKVFAAYNCVHLKICNTCFISIKTYFIISMHLESSMEGIKYSAFANIVTCNCLFPTPGKNCMTQLQVLQDFPI